MDPTDAASELLDETITAYEGEVKRLLELNLIEPAMATTLGVVAGLYRSRDCRESEQALAWAPDFPLDRAWSVLGVLATADVDVSPERIAEAAPDWAASLTSARVTWTRSR